MKRFTLFAVVALGVLLLQLPGVVRSAPPLDVTMFMQSGVQGLDASNPLNARQNSWAWAMGWFKGHLYVGTNRAFDCTEAAALAIAFPGQPNFPYPPNDPNMSCTPDPADLPLQAEIWRWTPPNTWDRVFQSPNDVPIPNHPGKFVARDTAFRGMLVYTEPDGTQALYVGGVSAGYMWNTPAQQLPPPRILRSTDGVNFAPIPQDPGTVLGTMPGASWRNPTAYNGKFYIQGGSIKGQGVLYESANPAAGNNTFQQVSAPGLLVSASAAFNGWLYVGLTDPHNGYTVAKTNATGTPPYALQPIVTNGGGRIPPNVEILSTKIFQGHLYMGANGVNGNTAFQSPAELIRINPDDSWDLVVGDQRTYNGTVKTPLSGLPEGFGNSYNDHMWRMEVFDNNLYVSTFDASVFQRNSIPPPTLQNPMGFDMYRTPDGINFTPVTTDGFGDMFNMGGRNMVATPYGLFIGTADYWYGLKVYLGIPPNFRGFQLNVPLLVGTGAGSGQPTPPPVPTNTSTPRPTSGPTNTPFPTNTSFPTRAGTKTATGTPLPTSTATAITGASSTPTHKAATRTPTATSTQMAATRTLTATSTVTGSVIALADAASQP